MPAFTLQAAGCSSAVSRCRVSVVVRSLLEFESGVSIALLLVAPSANPLHQSYLFLFGFLICKDWYV